MALSVKNLKAVQEQLKSVEAEMRPKLLRSAMRAAFKPVQEDAKSRVPVDTGELREAITIGSAKGKGGSMMAVGLVVVANSARAKQARVAAAAFGEGQSKALPPARRWHFIELGTARQAPRPFLRPALHANQQQVVADLTREVAKKVKRALKKRGGRR